MTKILREPPDRDRYYAGADPREVHRANYRFARYGERLKGDDFKRFHAWVNGWTWANTGDDNDQES